MSQWLQENGIDADSELEDTRSSKYESEEERFTPINISRVGKEQKVDSCLLPEQDGDQIVHFTIQQGALTLNIELAISIHTDGNIPDFTAVNKWVTKPNSPAKKRKILPQAASTDREDTCKTLIDNVINSAVISFDFQLLYEPSDITNNIT